MQVIAVKSEQYSITVNGWIVGHRKASQQEYADKNIVRSTLFIIGTLSSTARAFANENLRSSNEFDNVVYLGADRTCPVNDEPICGMVILTPDLGYVDDKTRRTMIATLNALANATQHEHDLVVLVPPTIGYYELMEDLIDFHARNNSHFTVMVKGAEPYEKTADDDRSVFTFDDYVKYRAANTSIAQFVSAEGPVGRGAKIRMHSDLAVLDGGLLFNIMTGLRSTGREVILHFDVWRNIHTYLDGEARRQAYFDSKPCERKAVRILQ